MGRLAITLLFTATLCLFGTAVLAKDAGEGKTGKELFEQHCAVCHPNGDNIVNPTLTLSKKALAARNVKTAADVIGKIRNPGPGMTAFDKGAIPDSDAKKIADYILKTFK